MVTVLLTSAQLEQQYQEKVEQLSRRERDMMQRLQRREEVMFLYPPVHDIKFSGHVGT